MINKRGKIISLSLIAVIFLLQMISAQSQQIDSWNDQLISFAIGESSLTLQQVIDIAKSRETVMIELMHTNPDRFLNYVLPPIIRNALPIEISQYLEEPIEMGGKLQILIVDSSEKDVILHRLANSKVFNLYFLNNLQIPEKPEDMVVYGFSFKDNILVERFEIIHQIDKSENPENEEEVAVVFLSFRDKPFRFAGGEETFKAALDMVSDFYREQSYGRVNLNFELYHHTIDRDLIFDCFDAESFLEFFEYDIGEAGKLDMITNNPSKIIGVSPIKFCDYIYGMAYIGGKYSVVKQMDNIHDQSELISHELGHNFGLHHIARHDGYDVMNHRLDQTLYMHFGGHGKNDLEWFKDSNVLHAKKSGVYTIYPFETATDKPQLIMVDKYPYSYYVFYKTPYGFDDRHLFKTYNNGPFITYNKRLVDGNPAMDRGYSLDQGMSFRNPKDNVEIKSLIVTPDSATMHIDVGCDYDVSRDFCDDGIDNDCNGLIDEGCLLFYYPFKIIPSKTTQNWAEGANIKWGTNLPTSRSKDSIRYGTNPSNLEYTAEEYRNTLYLHEFSLFGEDYQGLIPGERYYFEISSTDQYGNTESLSDSFVYSPREAILKTGKQSVLYDFYFTRSDVNNDNVISITDGIFLLDYLFKGGDAPICPDSADINDDGNVDLTDSIYLFQYLFLGGQAPVNHLEPGLDKTPDKLVCA